MQARDVMAPSVVSLRPHLPARAAVALLNEWGFTAAPVMNAEGRVLGVVSKYDLVRGQQGADDGEATARTVVADLMVPSPPTVDPDTDLALVAASMLDAGVRCVPVLESGRLVGVVTRHALQRVADGAAARSGARTALPMP